LRSLKFASIRQRSNEFFLTAAAVEYVRRGRNSVALDRLLSTHAIGSRDTSHRVTYVADARAVPSGARW
jgi:hypothetical protein